jgi:hypothetical protein
VILLLGDPGLTAMSDRADTKTTRLMKSDRDQIILQCDGLSRRPLLNPEVRMRYTGAGVYIKNL